MSFEYFVAVHQQNWPTAAALQSMAERKYPVVLGQAPTQALVAIPHAGSLPVRFENREIELEASLVQLSPTKFYAYTIDQPPDARITTPELGTFEITQLHPDDVWKGSDINADLAEIGAKGVHFGNGDYVLTLSFHSAHDEVRAGFYVMAALIKCFGGYGFELQTSTHGTKAFADDLVATARDEKNWK